MSSAGRHDPPFDRISRSQHVCGRRREAADLKGQCKLVERFKSYLFSRSNDTRCVWGRALCTKAVDQPRGVRVRHWRCCPQDGSTVFGFQQADVVGHGRN